MVAVKVNAVFSPSTCWGIFQTGNAVFVLHLFKISNVAGIVLLNLEGTNVLCVFPAVYIFLPV
jgi:hypothetical protein